MKNPKSEDMYEVVELFRSVQDYPGRVDMMEMDLRKESCGTVACMAGWYFIALIECKCYDYILDSDAFRTGSGQMSNSLGFKDGNDLVDWAHANPDYWGNEFGGDLFCRAMAYGKEPGESVTVKEIADHFFGVANRLKTMEDVGVLVPEQIDGTYGRLETHWKDGSVRVTTVEDREKNV